LVSNAIEAGSALLRITVSKSWLRLNNPLRKFIVWLALRFFTAQVGSKSQTKRTLRGKAAAAAVVIVGDCREAAVVFIIDAAFCSSGRGHVSAPAAERSSGARVW
jgi:hypothetical protein